MFETRANETFGDDCQNQKFTLKLLISLFSAAVWISGRRAPSALHLSIAWDHPKPAPREKAQAHEPSNFLYTAVPHATVLNKTQS